MTSIVERIQNEILQDYYQQQFSNDGQRFVAWYMRNIHLLDQRQTKDAITDGPDDKQIDAVYIDEDEQKIFIVQGKYYTGDVVDAGPVREVISSWTQFKDLATLQDNANAKLKKKIAEIATKIAEDPSKKFIMIAGPSSSGKTSFSHRLSVQLRANGLKPHPIPVDDYFVDREFTPRDENGDYNFETLDAIQQLTGDMPLVLHGGTGIPAEMIQKAISLGVSKINVNTECQLAFADATRKYIEEGKDLQGKGFDPRKLLAPGFEAIKATVREKIALFGSANKA